MPNEYLTNGTNPWEPRDAFGAVELVIRATTHPATSTISSRSAWTVL